MWRLPSSRGLSSTGRPCSIGRAEQVWGRCGYRLWTDGAGLYDRGGGGGGGGCGVWCPCRVWRLCWWRSGARCGVQVWRRWRLAGCGWRLLSRKDRGGAGRVLCTPHVSGRVSSVRAEGRSRVSAGMLRRVLWRSQEAVSLARAAALGGAVAVRRETVAGPSLGGSAPRGRVDAMGTLSADRAAVLDRAFRVAAQARSGERSGGYARVVPVARRAEDGLRLDAAVRRSEAGRSDGNVPSVQDIFRAVPAHRADEGDFPEPFSGVARLGLWRASASFDELAHPQFAGASVGY